MVDILIIESLLAVIPLVATMLPMIFITNKRRGPLIAALALALKKRKTIVSFSDMGATYKFKTVDTGATGMLHDRTFDFIPDKQSVNFLKGMPPFAIASSDLAGTLSPRFLWENKVINDYMWKTEHKTSAQVADKIEYLRAREKSAKRMITLANDLLENKITIENATTEQMIERGYPLQNETAHSAIKAWLEQAKSDKAARYELELKNVEKEKNIPVEEKAYLRWVKGKPFIAVSSFISPDNFVHAVNVGGDANLVHRMISDAAEAERYMHMTTGSKIGKWLLVGVVFCVIIIGIVILATGLHV